MSTLDQVMTDLRDARERAMQAAREAPELAASAEQYNHIAEVLTRPIRYITRDVTEDVCHRPHATEP